MWLQAFSAIHCHCQKAWAGVHKHICYCDAHTHTSMMCSSWAWVVLPLLQPELWSFHTSHSLTTPSHFERSREVMGVIEWTKMWHDIPGLTLESHHSISVLHQWSRIWARSPQDIYSFQTSVQLFALKSLKGTGQQNSFFFLYFINL